MRGDRWGLRVRNAFVLRLLRPVVNDYACLFGFCFWPLAFVGFFWILLSYWLFSLPVPANVSCLVQYRTTVVIGSRPDFVSNPNRMSP